MGVFVNCADDCCGGRDVKKEKQKEASGTQQVCIPGGNNRTEQIYQKVAQQNFWQHWCLNIFELGAGVSIDGAKIEEHWISNFLDN